MSRFDPPKPPPDPALARIEQAIASLAEQMQALGHSTYELPVPQVSVSPTPVNVSVPTEGITDAVTRAIAEALAALPEPEVPQIALDRVTADVDLLPLVEAAQDQRAVLEALQEKLSNMTAGSRSHFDGRLRHKGRSVEENNPLPVTLSEVSFTPFKELQVASRSSIFNLSSVDPLSILRDYTEVVGAGTVTSTLDEFELATTTSGDSALLETAERGRYAAGFVAEAGIGVRLDSRPAGSTIEFGLLEGDDGIGVRVDDGGLELFVRRNGTDLFSVSQADFNGSVPQELVDKGVEAWLQEGVVFQFKYLWYGYGPIQWSVIDKSTNHTAFRLEEGRSYSLHTTWIESGTTSVQTPNLPISVKAMDGATIYVGGRQYSVLGDPARDIRRYGVDRLNQTVTADTTFQPLIALRRRTDVTWPRGVQLLFDSADILTDTTLVVQRFIGATVSGGSWVSPPNTDDSAAVEVNLTATSMSLTGAVALGSDFATAAGRNQSAASTVEADAIVPRAETLVLAAKSITATTDADVSSILDWQEVR